MDTISLVSVMLYELHTRGNIVYRFRDHVPVVFLPDRIHQENVFVVAKSGQQSIVANTLPISTLGKINDGMYINNVLYEVLGKPRKVIIESIEPQRSILVYGTLLSRYWNPHTCLLYTSPSPRDRG